jgi:rhamnose transport system ATP-binding protein
MVDQKTEPIVKACKISKSFSGVEVLHKVDLDIYPGEIHALVGENGAGKTTLMKIISGVYQPDHGSIFVEDKNVEIASPRVAEKLGIALIHQEPLIFSDLDVAENIFIGHNPLGNKLTVQWSWMYAEAKKILDSLDVKLDPKAQVKGLSIADQQMVELASALSQEARVLLMDEPTASLTPGEVETLFTIMKRLKDLGTAIVFISHRLEEVIDIADRITVLRDGAKVETCAISDTCQDEIIHMMVGRVLDRFLKKIDTKSGDILLLAENLTREGYFKDISFEVRSGEVVGFAGLVGAGRTDVADALFGITRLEEGAVELAGERINIRSPQEAIDKGIGYVPEDRQGNGLLMEFSVANNITFAAMKLISRFGWLKRIVENRLAEKAREQFNIIVRNVNQPVRELSGGNQQKVVLSKWLLNSPRLLILDEPTRGIDVGAKAEVHALINDLAKEGKGVLMISSDLPEVLALSDRIYVLKEGRIVRQYSHEEATQEKIMAAAAGQS